MTVSDPGNCPDERNINRPKQGRILMQLPHGVIYFDWRPARSGVSMTETPASRKRSRHDLETQSGIMGSVKRIFSGLLSPSVHQSNESSRASTPMTASPLSLRTPSLFPHSSPSLSLQPLGGRLRNLIATPPRSRRQIAQEEDEHSSDEDSSRSSSRRSRPRSPSRRGPRRAKIPQPKREEQAVSSASSRDRSGDAVQQVQERLSSSQVTPEQAEQIMKLLEPTRASQSATAVTPTTNRASAALTSGSSGARLSVPTTPQASAPAPPFVGTPHPGYMPAYVYQASPGVPWRPSSARRRSSHVGARS